MSLLSPGISVVLPSFQGIDFLPRVLSSLANQKLDFRLFEVLVVLNGPDDGSRSIVEDFCIENPSIELKVFESAVNGASRARNIGISGATREYLTFVDVDDELEEGFLKTALNLVDSGTCALMPIVDVLDGRQTIENSLNVRIQAHSANTRLLSSLPWALGFNACKVVPTDLLNQFRYQEKLRSGEDVAFFANLLRFPDLLVTIPEKSKGNSYLRHQQEKSVSRQSESFEFNVLQRLQCISEIESVEVHPTVEKARAYLTSAQFSFVEAYLKEHPEKVDAAVHLAVELKLVGYDFASLRREKAKRLVFSYCFPPYADTSANVAAKQIAEEGQLVDVIFANMSRVRRKDSSTQLIGATSIARREEVDVDPSFSNWPLITSFARSALRKAVKIQREQGLYESMYSRALWSGSHVAAALMKSQFPKIEWEAEFSDPLRMGVDGKSRKGKVTWGWTTSQLKRIISRSAWPGLAFDSHYALLEAVTFIAADRLVFTNEMQRQVMLGGYPETLRDVVISKSIIRPHAAPQPELFELEKSQSHLDESVINIGYFGAFYENRGIGNVIDVLEGLPDSKRSKFALHIYSNDSKKVELLLKSRAICSKVHSHDYLPYLQFLATANLFDVLLVNDVDISESSYDVNPFLPSKYADYAASNAAIWGVVSEASALSYLPLNFRSDLSDKESLTRELYRMIEELG